MFMFKTTEMLRGLSWIMRGKLLWMWTYCLIKPLLRTLESRTYCTSPYISGYLCGACITLSFLIWANEYKCVCGIICVNRLSKANRFANWPDGYPTETLTHCVWKCRNHCYSWRKHKQSSKSEKNDRKHKCGFAGLSSWLSSTHIFLLVSFPKPNS